MSNPTKIWQQYRKIVDYVAQRDLYEIVKTNENFYDGKQWEGLDADTLPKPVINILQRVVKYMIATLSSNDVAVTIKPFSDNEDDVNNVKPIEAEIERVIEQAKIKETSKLAIRNGAIDGSAYMLQEFNPEFDTGQDMKGCIENKLIHCTNVYFGNPYSNEIQTQPYIIVALRQNIKQVKKEAERLGLSDTDIDQIKPDQDTEQPNDDSDNLVTVLLKFERKRESVKDIEITMKELGEKVEIERKKEIETIYMSKSTRDVFLIEPVDLGYKRYPISRFGWDPILNSYLFNSPMTAVIPNQVFINKCYALAQMYGLQSAFPKIVYDKSKADINDLLDSTSASAVANIDTLGKFLDFIKVPDFSSNIMSLLDNIIQQTKECMGVNDSALGNVKPDNTSAILALQEGANTPLEIQRQEYFEMWEDTIRNIIDIMACTYGVRDVLTDEGMSRVDFNALQYVNFDLVIDVGTGAQYSEIAQMNTLDKLLQNGIIDAETYVESVPNKYMPNKGKILNYLKEQKQKQQQMAMPNELGNQGL